MRAVVVERPGGPDVLTLVDVPRPHAEPDEVLVEVEAVGVNPVDLGNRADPSWAGLHAPYVLGYELAGHVVDTGEPVWALLPVQGTSRGALAEQVACPRGFLAPRPPELHAIVAAALPMAGCTALQVLERMPLAAGSWVYVYGATGGVGHLLVQLARARGLRVAAAGRPEEHRRLEELGVDVVVDRSEPSPVAVAAHRLGHELDAVVDLVGGRLERSLPHVRVGGHAATVVDLAGDLGLAIDRNIDLHGVLVRPGRDALYELSAAVAAGLRPHVGETSPSSASPTPPPPRAGAVRGARGDQ